MEELVLVDEGLELFLDVGQTVLGEFVVVEFHPSVDEVL